ncbi:MAG: translocation protein TolB [Pseudobdellovibrio sp.]
MLKLFFINLFLSLSLFSAASHADEVYIKAGEARAKKSNLAFPFFNSTSINNPGTATTLASDIYNIAKKNLELSTYFQLIDKEAYLEDPGKTGIKPKPEDPLGFTFEPLKTINAEFLIRAGYTVAGKDMTVEMYLYHVADSKLVVGKRYKAPVTQATQIGHLLANDVIEALTGVRAPFQSKIVAAFNNGTGFKEICTMNWDGSEFEQISNHRSIAISPSWSPDGKKIAYSAFTTFVGKSGTRTALYILDLATNKRVLTSYRPGMNSGAIFSKDVQSIYLSMTMGSGSADIYKIDMKGEVIKRLTNGPAGAINVEPTLNPDGTKIAFSSERGGRPMIYTMNADGGDVKRLTFKGKFNSSPTWSPDGSKIAFAAMDEGNFDIFVMNADGSNLTRVTSAKKANGKASNNEDPSFSPDSRYLVYTSDRTGKNQIFISSLDGSEERRVTNDSKNYFRPKWSVNLE